MTAEYDEMGAVLSDDVVYRYELERWWGSGPGVLWIMLNPSTADAHTDDPTIRRCRGFTERWGFDGFGVVNLFAYRATDPAELRGAHNLVSPRNEQYVRRWLRWQHVDHVVAAWGGWKFPRGSVPRADADVALWAREEGRSLHCLGTTKSGDPRHPLYVPYDQPPILWASDLGGVAR